jgi:hypothetical protein
MRRAVKITRWGALAAAVAALVGGCGGGIEPGGTADLASPLIRIGLVCPNDLCGGTKVLHTDGTPNHAGAELLGIFGSAHGELTPTVTADRLGGVDSGGTVYDDFQLLGDSLRVRTPRGDFDIEIHAVASPRLWVGDGAPPGRAYSLQYRRTGEPKDKLKPFCGHPDASAIWRATSGLAFIFRGDDIDDATRSVTANQDQVSFNLACAGDPNAGIYMAGHSEASDPNHLTGEPDRQAMLKMLAGDYCGTGVSYAFDTPPEHFVDASKRLPPLPDAPTAKTLEALWTAKGAACLQNPRFPELANQIAAACALPRCDELSPAGIPGVLAGWQQLGHVLSANQQP